MQREREAESKAKLSAISSIVKEREILLSFLPSLGCRSSTPTSLELFVLVQGKPLVLTCKPSIVGQEPTQFKLTKGTLFDVQVYREVQGEVQASNKDGGSSKKKKGPKGKEAGPKGGSGWVSLPSSKDPARVAVTNLSPGTEYRVRVRLGLSADCSILSEQEWQPFGDEVLVSTKAAAQAPSRSPAPPPDKKPAPEPPMTPTVEPRAPPPSSPSPSPTPTPADEEESSWLEDLGGSFKCNLCGTMLKSWDQVEKHEMTAKHQKKAIRAGVKTSNFNFNEDM